MSSTPTWSVTPTPVYQVNSVAINADGQRCVFGTSSEYGDGVFSVFAYSGSGELLWQNALSQQSATQGVFWVAISANGKYASAGGELAKDQGFLRAYNVDTGVSMLDASLSGRVNQVSLSADGNYLLAVYENSVQLYSLNAAKSAYILTDSHDLSPSYLNSAVLSTDGQHAVVSAMLYSEGDSTSTSGSVLYFSVDQGTLAQQTTFTLASAGPMRVAMTENGECFGAALHDGSCVVYRSNNLQQALWQYTPTVAELSVAYGFDLTLNQGGQLIVACGANTGGPKGGYLYVLTSLWQIDKYVPQLLWDAQLDYAANPGVCLDKNATYVTATDGKPSNPPQESPGNFYLFDVASGQQCWKFTTSLMNWPMMISADASRVFGGSDNGSVYCWAL
jgi:WD40 repeat protein